jgi:hypothetical protein
MRAIQGTKVFFRFEFSKVGGAQNTQVHALLKTLQYFGNAHRLTQHIGMLYIVLIQRTF